MLASLLGGIGLFLLGMSLMTDGLKAVAGDTLRRVLTRFTGGPISSLLSGAGLTALVQSSSATTLATIGFVSAGLLTFPQAVGVIFGANVGTTSTSWIVSTVGLKLNVSALALPLIGVGALMRLLGRGRVAQGGLALAGFGLIFVGIDTLQAGMKGFAESFDPSTFPSGGIGARMLLVLVGAVMTVVMQSSSAAVATTLTALHSGTIDLEQAAALVVGQNVGTTVTAGIASIGASVPAKRTALAHVLFNAVTGFVAFLILPLFVRLVVEMLEDADPAVKVAAFHTVFNFIGVLIFLPFTRKFAEQVEKWVPDRGPQLTRHLDMSVTHVAGVAVETARRTTHDIAIELLGLLRDTVAGTGEKREDRLTRIDGALTAVREFLTQVAVEPEGREEHERHLAVLHAVDHLGQLGTFAADTRAPKAVGEEDMRKLQESIEEALATALAALRGEGQRLGAAKVDRHFSQAIQEQRKMVLDQTASGELQLEAAMGRLEAIRWIDRVAHHSGRIVHYLGGYAESAKVDEAEPAKDDEAA